MNREEYGGKLKQDNAESSTQGTYQAMDEIAQTVAIRTTEKALKTHMHAPHAPSNAQNAYTVLALKK